MDSVKKNILILDENRGFAHTFKEAVLASGHNADLAFTGEEALAMYSRNNYRIAFMNFRNGLSFQQNLSGTEIVSGTNCRQVKQLMVKALEHGIIKVLNKPFDFSVVLDLIETDSPVDFVLMT